MRATHHIAHTYRSLTRIYLVGQSILAARFVDEISGRQSAMSHEYFGKRVLLGAQVATFSILAMATRKHTTATSLVHTAVYCPKTVPEPAAAGGR